jgi:drug/metabolite transporter (DMT)-like permease
MPQRASSSAILLAFAAIYIIWGTTFLGIALVLRSLPPFFGGSVRFLAASLLMYLWLRWRDPRPFAGLSIPGTVLCGVLMTGMGNGFVIYAQTGLPSGVAALFIAVLPVLTLLLDWAFYAHRRPASGAVAGVTVGFAGILVLTVNLHSLSGAIRPIHVAAVIVAELAWANATLLQRRYVPIGRVASFTCLQMFIGSLFQLLMGVINHEWTQLDPSRFTLSSLVALLYLIVFGSLVAFNCFSFLVARVAPQKITTYALVNPMIALALGALVLGEKITPAALLAASLVLLGVALVLFPGVVERRGPRGGAAVAELENQ